MAEEAHQQRRRDAPTHTSKSTCIDCNKFFTTEEALQQHLRDLSAHMTTFLCIKCKKSFKTEKALQQHRQNSPAHSTSFACTKCSKPFETREALQQHQRDLPTHATSSDDIDSHRTCDTQHFLQQYEMSDVDSGSAWSMYPSLHDDVSRLLEADDISFGFCEVDDANNSIPEYDTKVMGRFTCKNSACLSSGWSSKRVAITIPMYPGKLYNARIYKQRCNSCGHLGEQPTLDHSYAERVAYRLKKWCEIQMALPQYSVGNDKQHHSGLCEGCRNGRCGEKAYK